MKQQDQEEPKWSNIRETKSHPPKQTEKYSKDCIFRLNRDFKKRER